MKHICIIIGLFIFAFSFGQEPKSEGEIEGLKLYPNPVIDGKIYIETLNNSPKKIVVFDILGTQVLETIVQGSELNVSGLNVGIYVLRILENNKMATRKLIIK